MPDQARNEHDRRDNPAEPDPSAADATTPPSGPADRSDASGKDDDWDKPLTNQTLPPIATSDSSDPQKTDA